MKAFFKKYSKAVKVTGYVILLVSCILFILIPVVPFTGLPVSKIAAITAGLFIAGEILFYLGLFILGRSFLEKIKGWLKFRKLKSNGADISSEADKNIYG
jgi:hypothetical protein